jgi:hypothetical protein
MRAVSNLAAFRQSNFAYRFLQRQVINEVGESKGHIIDLRRICSLTITLYIIQIRFLG